MSIYGLADCNNFFVSCERVFRPPQGVQPGLLTRRFEALHLRVIGLI